MRNGLSCTFILFLSGLGGLAGVISSQEFAKALPGWFWLVMIFVVVPVAIAGWITRKTATDHFLYGCLVSGLYHAIWVCTSLVFTHHAEFGPSLRDYIASLFALLAIGVVVGVGGLIIGIWWGFITWLIGRFTRPFNGEA